LISRLRHCVGHNVWGFQKKPTGAFFVPRLKNGYHCGPGRLHEQNRKSFRGEYRGGPTRIQAAGLKCSVRIFFFFFFPHFAAELSGCAMSALAKQQFGLGHKIRLRGGGAERFSDSGGHRDGHHPNPPIGWPAAYPNRIWSLPIFIRIVVGHTSATAASNWFEMT